MIIQRIVPENERFDFYPSITKKYIFFESYSYLLSERYIVDFNGGCYEFVDLVGDNHQVVERFVYSTTSEGKVRLVNVDNYADVTQSEEGAGLALFMCIILIMRKRFIRKLLLIVKTSLRFIFN